MQKTTNLQLNKPDTEDYYDISVQNENMDIIDSKIAEIDNTSTTAKSSIDTHITNKSNPHSVTKAQVGLSNVPNVSTNDQTPTFTPASSDANLTSGEKLSTAFGKIAKAISSLISHLSNTGNPHSVTKSQVGLENVPNVSTNNQTPTYTEATSDTALKSGENLSTAFGKIARAVNSLISHITNTNNPHNTTATQVGLGNVPNVATNDQTPTYTVAGSNTALTSGEKLNVAFGKIAKAINSLISHLSNTSNPHSVTATQVGLGNVANVTTNNQTPTYTVASSNTALSSGENLSTAFGKIAKAINSLISHLSDTIGHITSSERTAWNAKLDATAKAVDSDKLDGLDSTSFPLCSDGYGYNTFLTNDLNKWLRNGIYGVQQDCTPLPSGVDGWGSIIVFTSVGGRTTQLAWFWNELGQPLWRRLSNNGGETWAEWVRIADSGNTALVKVQSTAPTDTNSLWIY